MWIRKLKLKKIPVLLTFGTNNFCNLDASNEINNTSVLENDLNNFNLFFKYITNINSSLGKKNCKRYRYLLTIVNNTGASRKVTWEVRWN